MSHIEEALQKFIAGSRVIEGYDAITELWNLICPLFGDTRVVQRTGLVKQYQILKGQITETKQLPLIIYGANISDDRDRIVDDYLTQYNTEITMTLKSICQAFLKDHITDDEIKNLLT